MVIPLISRKEADLKMKRLCMSSNHLVVVGSEDDLGLAEVRAGGLGRSERSSTRGQKQQQPISFVRLHICWKHGVLGVHLNTDSPPWHNWSLQGIEGVFDPSYFDISDGI